MSEAPVERITASARRISARNLSERIQCERADDELGRLVQTLNAMVDRLGDSLEATRRFTADASHELMTPLTQIRAEVEVALQSERTNEEYRDVLRSNAEEVARLTRLVRQLLNLAREDANFVQPQREDCPLQSVIDAATDSITTTAAEAGVMLIRGESHSLTLLIDPDHLRLALDKLLLNAVQSTPSGGHVLVSTKVSRGEVVISVADSGIGIPTDSLPYVFDRFYRVDPSRTRRVGGTGLGLSIARTLIERMGGSIEVEVQGELR